MAFDKWRRVPDANACDFCLMLATRGAVYESAATAGAGHRNCNCGVELETRRNRAKDTAVPPDAADRIVSYYNRKVQRRYAYDLARYVTLGVTEAPPLRLSRQQILRFATRRSVDALAAVLA